MAADREAKTYPHMYNSTDFLLKGISSYDRLHSPVQALSERLYAAEYAQLLGRVGEFQVPGRGGSLIDICLPSENGETVPVAIKVFNTFSSQFNGVRQRMGKWAHPEEIASAASRITVPETVGLPDHVRQTAGLLALEHQMYERMYSPYILPAEFVGFVPQVDVIDNEPHSIGDEERKLRADAGAMTADGRRYIMQKGVPAVAMVEDYLQDIAPIDGTQPLQAVYCAQLGELIKKIEKGYREGFYPDPAIARPDRQNLVIANGTQLVLIDSNFLLSTQESFAKKDFNGILDALYYFAR